MTPASDTKKFVEYRDDDAEREKYENTKFRKVEIAGKDYRVDMKVIEPYKKVLSHGGKKNSFQLLFTFTKIKNYFQLLFSSNEIKKSFSTFVLSHGGKTSLKRV